MKNADASRVVDIVTMASPWGDLEYAVHDGKMCALRFSLRHREPLDVLLKKRFGSVRKRAVRNGPFDKQLRSYFRGHCAALDEIPIDAGGTEFLAATWSVLRAVPAGTAMSYGELAKRIGKPRAVRAVARANATNPIALVIPCHRIIGSDGQLCGFGAGLDRKAALLRHEGVEM